jgi:hypothetical protein
MSPDLSIFCHAGEEEITEVLDRRAFWRVQVDDQRVWSLEGS